MFKYGEKHPEKELFYVGRTKKNEKYYNSFLRKEVFDRRNIEKRNYHTNLFKTNPFKVILNSAKNRMYSDLTEEFLLDLYEKQQGKCFWFGISMSLDRLKGYKNPSLLTVDRLDNAKGYTKDNVVLACLSANLGRGNTPTEIWKEFIKNFIK